MEKITDEKEYKPSKRYAKALLEISVENKNTDEIYKDLLYVSEILKEKNDLRGILMSPAVTLEDKKRIIGDIFSPLNRFTLNFLFVLAESNRFSAFDTILGCYKDGIDETEGVLNVFVTSAVELDEQTREKLTKKLENKTNKKIMLDFAVEKDIISGLIIQFKDNVIDLSLKNKLEKIEKQLV